jgi:hypothetical protein
VEVSLKKTGSDRQPHIWVGEDRAWTRRQLLAHLGRLGVVGPIAAHTLDAMAQVRQSPQNLRVLSPQQAEAASRFEYDRLAGTKAVIAPGDIQFLGFYRFASMPTSLFGQQRPSLAARKVGGNYRFFINGNLPDAAVYEIHHPAGDPGANPSTAPAFTLYKNWGDVRAGHRIAAGGVTTSAAIRVGGFFWDDARNALWWNYGDAYTQTNHPTIGCTIFNDANGTFQSFGPWRAQLGANRNLGSLLRIPSLFGQAFLGGDVVGCISPPTSGAGHSHGASLTSLELPDPATTPANTVGNDDWTIGNHAVVWHTKTNPQARDARYKLCGFNEPYKCASGATLEMGQPIWGTQNPAVGTSDGMATALWVDLPDKHGVLYFGSLVRTPEGYNAPYDADGLVHRGYAQLPDNAQGVPVCCHGQTDPFFSATGPWAHVRQPMGWIYDPSTFVASATGVATLHSRTPVHTFAWNDKVSQMPLQNAAPSFAQGAVFVAESRRLYVPFMRLDVGRPVVLVFQIA